MGLRGPGAKPLKKVDFAAPAKAPERQKWERRGLSRVARVTAFLESLPITSGIHAGKRFKVRPWQGEFLEALYETRRGKRLVRTAVLSLGRKNGKTALASPLALCHLSGPESEERGECYAAANDRFQASRIFHEMAAIVARVPFLDDRISLKRHDKTGEDFRNGSIFAALSADVGTKHGLSPSMVIYDELGQAPNRGLFDVLDTSMGARAEPLLLAISTQAASDHAPMSELVDYGLRINSGEIIDLSFHLTFYTAPSELDPFAEETWRLANPALGDFRSLEDVRRMAAQAKRMPSKEPAFRNLILNQRVSAEAQFMSRAEWLACGGAVDIERLEGRVCYGGLDLSATRDLTALVLAFPDDNGSFDILCFFWTPADTLEDRERTDRAPYSLWVKQGFLRTTPGRSIDPAFIAKEIGQISSAYGLRALAYDRWRISDLQRELDKEGIGGFELVPFGQGFRDMGPAVEKLLSAVADRRLRHGNNPVLSMSIANARAVTDPSGNAKLDKSKSTGRIDGAVAACMALSATRKQAAAEWVPFCALV